MLTRDLNFLKHKYRELLLPTLLMLLSDKICLIADAVMIGYFFEDSSFLSAINMASPYIYFSAVLYTLFGVGGSLLALRAKADQDDEKANFYFTAAIVGVLLTNAIYIILILAVGNDLVMFLYDMPQDIHGVFLSYSNILIFYFPFLCYILTLGYFARSDGYPNLPFVALLISNISNIIISYSLMEFLDFGVAGSALGSVIGYALGSLYISIYFLKKDRDFYLTKGIRLKESLMAAFEFLKNTPEIISRIFITFKVLFYSVLCADFLGIAGLMAFLVYDNSETVVYMFVSAIAKVMTPIVAVFYKEKDYGAVEYIVRRSVFHILLISIPVSILFAVYPELFTYIFTLDDPAEAEIICTALRITSLGLAARCLSLLLSSYTQAIEENRLASLMNISEEFIVAFGGAIVLTSIYGAIGIWYALVLADIVPIIIYGIASLIFQIRNEERIRAILLLQDTNTVTWTYERGIDDVDHYLHGEKKRFILKIEAMLNEKSPVALQSIDCIHENVMKDEDIQNIDVTVRYLEDTVTLTVTYEGKLINPIDDAVVDMLGGIGGDCEYSPILGFNRAYVNVPI